MKCYYINIPNNNNNITEKRYSFLVVNIKKKKCEVFE